jgi:Flp pilus assembly protein TadG
MVEAAIVLPLLLLLTLGVIEYGWLFLNAQWITNAARQGARIAAPAGATAQNGMDAIDALLAGRPVASRSVEVIAGTPPLVVATVTMNSADVVIVNAPALFPVPTTLKAQVVMAKEG